MPPPQRLTLLSLSYDAMQKTSRQAESAYSCPHEAQQGYEHGAFILTGLGKALHDPLQRCAIAIAPLEVRLQVQHFATPYASNLMPTTPRRHTTSSDVRFTAIYYQKPFRFLQQSPDLTELSRD
jgi:hypothetical protein